CPTPDPLLAMKPCDHFEIVAQSSGYGFPALRRIVDQNTPTSPTDPVSNALKRLPRSHVVRPEPPYEMLVKKIDALYTPEGQPAQPDTGIAIPQPFDRADV